MKKLVVFLLALATVLSFSACSEAKNEGKIDAADVVEDVLDQVEELDSFSEAAVEHYLKAYDISYDDLKPDWEYTVGDKSAYADEPESGYGHAVVAFKTPDGELTDEQMRSFYEQVFRITAAASDDGYNIVGYEFVSDGEDPMAEVTVDEALDSWMPGWGFRKDGKCMVVYVSDIYDNDKESEFDRLFYYNGVKFDIGVGLQKSWDDTVEDVEDYFGD